MPKTSTLNTREAARRLNLSPATITRYIREGRIQASRVPGKRTHWRIPESEIDRIAPNI